MESKIDSTVRGRWRLVRLAVVLLGVIYLTALSFLPASSTAPDLSFFQATAVVAGGVVLVGLGIASGRRRWRSPGALLALCGAVSLIAVACLLMAVETAHRQSQSPYGLFEIGSVIREAAHGYWPTLIILLCLLLFALVYPDSRSLVDSMIPIPILAWGIDSTMSHWLGFTALAHETEFLLRIYWLGVLASTLVLLVLLAVSAAWRSWLGMRTVQPRVLTLVGLTVLAVYADWAFSLFVTSMLLIR
jgi:hypothetical protein